MPMFQLTQISLEKTLSILSPFLLEDQPADAYKRIFPHGTRQVWNAERMIQTMTEHVLLQNTVCRLLTLHVTQTRIYLPLSFSELLNALTQFFSVRQTATNKWMQKLLLYDLQLAGLYAFFDMAHQNLLHPLFAESCKTYAALGKACIDHQRYQLVETDETPEPDLSDPLIRFVHDLPSGTPVSISVYLPVEKAVDNPTVQQMTALCGHVVLVTGICGGVDCVTELLGERK